jgi:glycosyltransferase involved in cell wall biosynthesis
MTAEVELTSLQSSIERAQRERKTRRVAIVASHVVQYHAPWYRALSELCDLTVLFAHKQSPDDHARAGYGVAFGWDTDVETGYHAEYLDNVAKEPSTRAFHGCDTPAVGERLRRGNFDAVIVSGWNLKTYWQTVLACRRLSIPVLVRGDSHLGSPRSIAKRAAKSLVYPLLLSHFDGFLSVGTRNHAYLLNYRVPERAIFFVPHHVDPNLFRVPATADERRTLRQQLGLPLDRTLALFVGRSIDFKRPLDLVEALAELERVGERFTGVFVGAGPLDERIKARADELHVSIAMLGFKNQSELPLVYAAADIFVLPSESAETWGLVVNEAMSCGLPAVVSDEVGCAPDLVTPGQTGEIFRCRDVPAFARALRETKQLLGTPRLEAALRQRMDTYGCGTAARNTVAALDSVVARRTVGLRRFFGDRATR